jgi:hypothetical protein
VTKLERYQLRTPNLERTRMELEDLYMLGACTILSGEKPMRNGYASTDETIAAAVQIAKRVWKEVIKQNKENDSDE